MKKITKEILQILSAVILMSGGLALILTYLDGRLLIGLVMMAAGSLILFVIARQAVEVKRCK